jgi:hypothetical protein
MSGTVAIDALRVDDWERKATGVAVETVTTVDTRHDDAQRLEAGAVEAPAPPWPRRKLNDALADLGPLRPGSPAKREPWSRTKMPRPDAPSTNAAANDDSASDAAGPPDTMKAAGGASDAAIQSDVELPPPPRPFRQPPMAAPEIPASEATIEGWGEFSLAADDSTGADIVRALVEANLPGDHGAPIAHADASPLDGDEPLERPPMIIERAIAEQSQGLVSLRSEALRASPLPGLAVGFSLSLVVGAAFYMVLVSG